MIDFPSVTAVHMRMPKEAFYKHMTLNKVQKDKFVSDVDRIFMENKLTVDNLHLKADCEIKEILLLSIVLKKQELDGRVVEAIAKQNAHNLVFLLIYENKRQLAIYYERLYRTEWMNDEELTLRLKGYSLDEIWNSFIEQIALYNEQVKSPDSLSIDERLEIQAKIKALEKLIAKTETAAWKEQQPKKQFALYTQLKEYERELEKLKNGGNQHE